MKAYFKFLIVILALTGIRQEIRAIPAYPFATTIQQPDGSTINIRQYGDEFMNYITTEDGYTIVKNEQGFYAYAEIENNTMIPSKQIARDKEKRSQQEKLYLKGIRQHLGSSSQAGIRNLQKSANANYHQNGLLRNTKNFDYSKFKGLILLVAFSDREFEFADVREKMDAMVNQKNYTENGSSGSVNDYFYDNSMGKFDPTFDIVGPVTIDFRQTDARQTDNAHQLAKAACIAADDLVNYKDYDRDDDGQVDMVYFIFAGGGSHVGGNNTNYVWPHASTLPNGFMLDHVSLGRYACSVELNGLEGSHIQDGIGTIVHEFSHVLGLKDYYDTDYSKSGGESEHPNSWSVMASGSYFNKSKTPCGYSLYERYALGWATPEVISGNNTHTLPPLHSSNKGYRINSAIEKEFFLLENRQESKWDEYLPGYGMLVFRVDSTDVDAWTFNEVNINPEHTHYELLRAQKTIKDKTVIDSNGDPFPGSGNITSLTNQTTPSLSSWSGLQTETVLTDIQESVEGNIQITTEAVMLQTYTEDFEEMEVTTGNAKSIQGRFCKWDFNRAFVQAPGSDKANGTKSVGIYKNGEIKTSTAVEESIHSASFHIWNPTDLLTTIRLYYSVNKGVSWIPARNSSNAILTTVAAGASAEMIYNINSNQPTLYKINMVTGGSTMNEMNYIDDFKLKYTDPTPPVAIIPINAEPTDHHFSITQEGARLSVKSDRDSSIRLYTINGVQLNSQKPQNGMITFTLPHHGIYLIRQDELTLKIIY